MEFNATIDLIIKDLDDACRIIDDLKSYPGVPELQVELAKAKCKSAGDVISLLKNIKNQSVATETEKKEVPILKTPAVIETKPAESILTIEERSEPVEKAEPVTTIRDREESKKYAELKPVTEKTAKQKPGSEIIADKFANMPKRINEQLGTRKDEEDVTEIIKSKHIHSLKEAIGVNDRFYFIREIFNGDKEKYDQAIARLENIQSVSDSEAVILSYTGSNVENEAMQQLLEIIKRKFSPNE